MSTALLDRLLFEVGELKRTIANLVQVGTVAARDATRGYRLDLGPDDEGGKRLSPWLPHPDAGGANSDWRPLSEGQIMAVIAPAGDLNQGFMVRAGFGGNNASPSQDLNEVVLHDGGGVRVAIAGGALVISVNDVTWSFSGSGLAQTGGAISHDGVIVDKSHEHTRVAFGPDFSGPPR